MDDERSWRVGELAAATGLTVRALHHFDEIGLVRPAARTAAGHRLYTPPDVRRLYRVLALRQLGVPLAEIGAALDGGVDDVEQAVRAQLGQVDEHLVRLRDLRRRLDALLRARAEAGQPTIDQLLSTMEAMMAASYFTPDQLARLRQRHREAGDDGFARWQARWAELAAQVRSHVEAGRDPADPAVQETAGQWAALMDRMTGGDRGILSAMYASLDGKGAEAATRGVVSGEVWEYMKRAFAVGYRV
ncbi:MerR family transcriptional regulator [Phytohabitans houttuyneae]|uniref:MerR family transcriptional regulator n=1 Tax=Phytohabitans houttuyneae TaxID=1076126 RepID=UPI00156621E1|nr:MerR family transcriptional regulator [Phytohabitans houttuyneae]